MGQTEILSIKAVTKQYRSTLPPAIDQVSFSLQAGAILSLLGASGCGKTTLLRLIAGFERPEAGSIVLNDELVTGPNAWVPPEQRHIGMVFQDYALFPHLTVAKNVAFGLTNRRPAQPRLTPQRIRDLAAEAIALVGLPGLGDRYPHQLSGGQQQRVALARALAPRPPLILLDEPLSNLDLQVRLHLRQEIRTVLKETGTSAIFVTHDQEEAMSISDWVAVIHQGQIEQLDTPETLYQQPRSQFVAEFVTQANFLPATRQGTYWQTEIGPFPITQIQSSTAPATPTTGVLMLRQEDIQLSPDDSSTIVIRDRQFLGREYSYSLLTGSGHTLRARTPRDRPLPTGTRVRLSTTAPSLPLFPAP